MISYITGTVSEIGENYAVIENNGIGYLINMPGSSLCMLSGGMGEVRVYTFMAVREDDISLYGFVTRAELDMFKMLITVSGVGPKGALGILGSIPVDELKMAIAAEDSKLIARAKGLGAKTAQKIVVELKGKIDKEASLALQAGSLAAPSLPASGSSASSEALGVLEALGFSRTAAVRAIGSLELNDELTSSEIVSLALKVIE